MTILWFFLALVPLVLVHELGHFAVAKLSGTKVEEFGIGFPPRVARIFTRGDTEYTLNALPLGGFVRLAGEDDPTVPGAFAAKSKAVRSAVLAAGPGANFLLAAVILSGIAMVGINETVPGFHGVLVGTVDEGMPAAEAGFLPGDQIVAVNGQALALTTAGQDDPTSGTTKEMIALTELTDASTGTPMTITAIRGLERVARAHVPDDLSAVAALEPWFDGRVVTTSPPGSALAPGDIVLGAGAPGGPVVMRGGRTLNIEVTPEFDAALGKGRIGVTIGPASLPMRLGLIAGLAKGVSLTWRSLERMGGMLLEMVLRRSPADISGPVGIARMSRQSAEAGAISFFGFMSLLSLNLGLINLLPIPALDGGRLVFIAIEALRRRRMEPSREQLVHVIGFVVVVGLMLVLTAVELADVFGVSIR